MRAPHDRIVCASLAITLAACAITATLIAADVLFSLPAL